MDYRTMVNPTYLTAKSTVFLLAVAGNEDAKRMIAGLGLEDALSRRDPSDTLVSENDAKALMTGVAVAIEARYAALSRTLKNDGCKNLLDVACGYTPRAIFCKNNGISYAGLDVPVVAEELQSFADKEGLGKVYHGGDATNAASLSAAVEGFEGEVLISSEGLLGYLSTSEFEQLLDGIRRILEKHSGAFVTSDMGVNYELFATANMSSPEAYDASRRRTMEQSDIYNEGVVHMDHEKVKAFIEAHGFKVEILPFYHGDENLSMLQAIPESWQKKYLDLLKDARVWKLTLDPHYTQKASVSGAEKIEKLTVDYKTIGGVLEMTVNGRIDTISAPTLLKVFDECSEGISSVRVKAEELEYISSAGLRTMMIMVKKLGQGNVTVEGASDEVKEIFTVTGFDGIIPLL
ncbi:MAG: STAS domain-containing protein [Ruminococcus sp.]|nr:STAS domain-containing protein [Ruminococcus sp.]